MRTLSLPCVLLLSALGTVAPAQDADGQAPEITVSVDPRVELLSIVFRLAGNPEYGQGKVGSYIDDVEAKFGTFRDHAVVKRARDLCRKRGVSYDAVMGLAVHLTDGKKLGEAVPFSPQPDSLDSRWTPRDARAFLRDLRRFAKDASFDEFIDAHEELYATAVERMQKVLREDAGFEWFDAFFGARPTASFTLVLGMLNGGACYGPRVFHRDGKEDLYCVLGVWETDGDGLPQFDASMLGTVAHEFCHSYCNPLIDAHLKELKKPAQKLWPHVAEAMKSQAYGNWQTMMRESLVRASVVRYQAYAGGVDAARKQADQDESRQFLWVGKLAELLEEYEKQREEYPDVEAFFPKITAFFEAYVPEFEKTIANRPKVVSMVPENGSKKVDPNLTEIRITFDRPMMDGRWAFVGGGPHYPEATGEPRYDGKCLTITLPVKLKPDWEYELWLNRGRFASFQSAERVKLQPVRVTFKTRAR